MTAIEQILRTKLHIPRARPELLLRPRLVERLNSGLGGRLTLISAPAGFGKTTVLSEWVRQCERPVAWISLDVGENDMHRFFMYFVAALQGIQDHTGDAMLSLLRSPQPPSVNEMLVGRNKEIAGIVDPFLLVLDDYHVIEEPGIQDALIFILENQPPGMHLVIAGRANPPWPLARLRARREMTELRAADLRFTSDEVARLLIEVMGLDLTPEDIATLETRTEGWVAGLQMAALSIQDREEISSFVKAFAGSHRYVLDYLMEEVLDQQPADVQEFLLKTSILDRLTVPLCDAVMGSGDSQRFLSYLDEHNLFLVPLDDERCWYRYHRLFADLLRGRLGQIWSTLLPSLHSRASQWWHEHGFIPEAVYHAMMAGDVGQAVQVIEGNALAMLDRGELATLVKWLKDLPEAVMHASPWLGVAYAWTLIYTGNTDPVESVLRMAQSAIDGLQGTAPPVDVPHIEGHIAAIRVYQMAYTGDFERAAELCLGALELLPAEDWSTRLLVLGWLSALLRRTGDFEGAARAAREAMAASRSMGDSHRLTLSTCHLAVLCWIQGRLYQAAAIYQELFETIDQINAQQGGITPPIISFAYVGLGTLYREWNELDTALRYIEEGVELSKQWGMFDVLAGAYDQLVRVQQAIGDVEGVNATLRAAIELAHGSSSRFAMIAALAEQAQAHLAMGNVVAASQWARDSGLRFDDNFRFDQRARYVILARVLTAQGRFEESLALLARLLDAVEKVGAMRDVIEILVLEAVALWGRDEVDKALAALERALFLAKPEGYVRIFIDEGKPMRELLREAAARGIAVDYVTRLLGDFEEAAREKGWVADSSPLPEVHRPSPAMFEPLSEREMSVLRYLPSHLSSSEIAEELYIATSTVRSHIKSIYSKLGVHSRLEGIERAEELGLL